MNYFLFILIAPFLFFFPGYCMVRRFWITYDVIEQCILSVFLSLAMMYVGIFAVEKIADKITVEKVTLVVLGINVLCLAVAFAPVQRIRQKMLRKFRGKDR